MKKIYLAIPYTGMEEKSYELATTFTAFMMSRHDNLNILSPITHSHPLTKMEGILMPSNFEYWKKIDYQFIDWCDEVWILVPDANAELIQNSIGVNKEIEYAEKTGKPVYLKGFSI